MEFYISKLQDAGTAYPYLTFMAENHSDLNPVEIHEYALKTLAHAVAGKGGSPVHLSTEDYPEVEEEHFRLAVDYLETHTQQFDGENIMNPDEIGVLGENFMHFSKGTVFLKRHTNFSECYWFFSCMRVVDGAVIRSQQPDEELEKQLMKLAAVKVIDPNNRVVSSAQEAGPEAAFIGALASTIVLALVGVVTKQIGTLALDYVMKALGIKPVEDNEKDYKQLIQLIKLEARQKVIDDMRRLLNAVVIALNDYNYGSNSLQVLLVAYERVDELLGHFLSGEKGIDTTIIRGNALVLHLSVLQEMAIVMGYKQRYTGYKSVVINAQEHAIALKEMRDASFDHRINLVTDVLKRNGMKNHYVLWYDDNGENVDSMKIHEDSLEVGRQEMLKRRENYLIPVAKEVNDAFTELDRTIIGLTNLGKGIIKGSKLSVANEQHVWMTLHGMVFQYTNNKWRPVFIDLTDFDYPANVWFTDVSVGIDGTVMALFHEIHEIEEQRLSICELKGNKWAAIDSNCLSLGVGDANNVWKVDRGNEVFRRIANSGKWEKMQGELTQISVGSDGEVWGLNREGAAMRFIPNKGTWENKGGAFSLISVGKEGVVWAHNANGEVFQYSGDTWQKKDFSKVNNLSVGAENFPWIEDESGNLFKCSHWEHIRKDSATHDVAVYYDRSIYCLDEDGAINKYDERSGVFEKVEGPANCRLKSISAGTGNNICGIQADSNGIPWLWQSNTEKWESLGDSAIGLSYGDKLWMLYQEEGFINYWNFGWHALPGEAARQISAGSGGGVWVLNEVPGIPHQLLDQRFTPVGTKKFKHLSVGGPTNICGIDPEEKAFRYVNNGAPDWQYIGTGLKTVSIGTDGTLFGIDETGRLLKWNPDGHYLSFPVKSPFADL